MPRKVLLASPPCSLTIALPAAWGQPVTRYSITNRRSTPLLAVDPTDRRRPTIPATTLP